MALQTAPNNCFHSAQAHLLTLKLGPYLPAFSNLTYFKISLVAEFSGLLSNPKSCASFFTASPHFVSTNTWCNDVRLFSKVILAGASDIMLISVTKFKHLPLCPCSKGMLIPGPKQVIKAMLFWIAAFVLDLALFWYCNMSINCVQSS